MLNSLHSIHLPAAWKMLRRMRVGVLASDFELATNSPRSFAVHSHSRLFKKPNGEGNTSVFSVVSIWNTLTPESTSTLPMRQLLLCSSLRCWSMKLRLCVIVCGLWWWRRLR